MKKGVQILLASFLSAFLAVFMYSKMIGPQEIIVEKPVAIPTYNNSIGGNDFPVYDNQPSTSSNVSVSIPTNFIKGAQKATPAVVYIKSKQVVDYNFWRGEQFGMASGSGVIISDDGYIATNNHVVENSKEITVQLNDNREFEAELVGKDPSTDIALLKIKGNKLPFVEFANSDNIDVGEWVLAVGNPFRLQSTVTAGIVSAKARNIDILRGVEGGIESFIQTDAAVNRGNSGGALVNTDGALIGINTAIITETGNYEGYSFAVPSNLVAKVIKDLKEFGAVQRGWMGVSIIDVDQNKAKALGLKNIEGIFLSGVVQNSAAQQAGLRKGDVIIGVNDKETSSVAEFMENVGQYRPGDNIEVKFIRNKRQQNTTVKLGNRINSNNALAESSPSESKLDDVLMAAGLQLRDLSNSEKRRLHTEGIRVIGITKDSKIADTNMEENYIITKINNERVNSVEDFVSKIQQADRRVFLDGFYEDEEGSFQYVFSK